MKTWLMKFSAITLLLCMLAACSSATNNTGATNASGDPFKQGQQAFKAGDYKTAFQMLYPLAIDGQADAQYAVGYMVYYGKGVAKDEQVGSAWIREAAIHGQSQAEQALELLSQKGTFNTQSSL